MAEEVKKYLRLDKFPHIWCAGCGNGIILQAMLRAVDKMSLDPNKVAFVSGIGCSSRAVGYVDFNTLHTAHGRALPFATGIKLVKPELTTIVFAGDGDISAIGGNHLIHAARRNINVTTIVINNSTYGMTSGQYSPMTPRGAMAATAPYGNIEYPFDLCQLAKAAGATYIARGTAYHVSQLPQLIVKAIENRGFSLVEVITQCPIYYGRANKMGGPVEMLKWQRDNAMSIKEASTLSPEEKKGKFVIGELYNQPQPEYTEEYDKIIAGAKSHE